MTTYKNQYGAIATIEFKNDWYFLTIDGRVSQSKDVNELTKILAFNGYKEVKEGEEVALRMLTLMISW